MDIIRGWILFHSANAIMQILFGGGNYLTYRYILVKEILQLNLHTNHTNLLCHSVQYQWEFKLHYDFHFQFMKQYFEYILATFIASTNVS